MFVQCELSAFNAGDFDLLQVENDVIELKSNTTGQYWLIRKFSENGYPPVVLFHKHSVGDHYHVHFAYGQDNALLAWSEITHHDRYIQKRDAHYKKITQLSKKKLLEAAFA